MNLHLGTIVPVLVIVVVLVIQVQVRSRQKQIRSDYNLAKNQRAIYIQRQWLDPVVELVIVGGVIWGDLQHGWLQWLLFLVGVVIGLPLGIVRGRNMYVGSIGKGIKSKIVIERNLAEISILVVLIVIKLAAHAISADPSSPLNLAAIALLGVGIASSIGRVIYITVQHYRQPRREKAEQSSDKQEKPGETASKK
jgi:hypothetical protein